MLAIVFNIFCNLQKGWHSFFSTIFSARFYQPFYLHEHRKLFQKPMLVDRCLVFCINFFKSS